MSHQRLLPEAAYDFWAEDGRDGEEGPPRDTIAEARRDARAMRKPLPWYSRCVITVEWHLNEHKLLSLLRAVPKRPKRKP